MRLDNSQSELEKCKEALDNIQLDTRKQASEWERLRGENTQFIYENERLRQDTDKYGREVDRYSNKLERLYGDRPSAVSKLTEGEIQRLEEQLNKAKTELRRAQAELRMNQNEQERSRVETGNYQWGHCGRLKNGRSCHATLIIFLAFFRPSNTLFTTLSPPLIHSLRTIARTNREVAKRNLPAEGEAGELERRT